MNISSLIEIVNRSLDKVKVGLQHIPAVLLICTCIRRPGFSSIITSAKIYADMFENENDEIVKAFVFNVVDKIKRNLQDDGVCFIAIPPGNLKVQLVGGNAGGPIALKGSNINFIFTWGIIR